MTRSSKCIYTLLIAVLVLACSQEPKSAGAEYEEVFSSVYLDLVEHLQSDDWVAPIDGDLTQRGSWNTKTLHGKRQLSGYFLTDGMGNPSSTILMAFEQYLMSRTGMTHLEGDSPTSVTTEDTAPYTMWLYNLDDRFGELCVWLFPCEDGKRIGFAVIQFEETGDLKRLIEEKEERFRAKG